MTTNGRNGMTTVFKMDSGTTGFFFYSQQNRNQQNILGKQKGKQTITNTKKKKREEDNVDDDDGQQMCPRREIFWDLKRKIVRYIPPRGKNEDTTYDLAEGNDFVYGTIERVKRGKFSWG